MRARPGEGRRPVTFPRALARYTRGAVNRVAPCVSLAISRLPILSTSAASPAPYATPRCARSAPGHRDRRLELRAPAGLVPEHPSGRHQPDAPGRRAAHPRRAGARPAAQGVTDLPWLVRFALRHLVHGRLVSSCPPCRHRRGRRPALPESTAAETRDRQAAGARQEAAGRLCAVRADLPGLRHRHRRCVRPRIPGFSPGGLGPHLTSSGSPRGLSSSFPFARRVLPVARLPLVSVVRRSPVRPLRPSPRFRFPLSVSLRVPLPLGNLHDSAAGRFSRRYDVVRD